MQTYPQSLVTICSHCVQCSVEWKVLLLLFELVTLSRTLCVPWRVTERCASGPSQVKGRKWGTFPDGCRALWVNSGHVEGTAQRGLKLGWSLCVSGTQTTTNFWFIIISVCIYLHSCLIHKCFSWRLFPKHVEYIRLLLCISPASGFLSEANLSTRIEADQQSWQYLEL